jgi:hypothetical protein
VARAAVVRVVLQLQELLLQVLQERQIQAAAAVVLLAVTTLQQMHNQAVMVDQVLSFSVIQIPSQLQLVLV